MRFLLWIRGRIASLMAPREQAPPGEVVDSMSIRARVALGCACLEKLCQEWNILSGRMPDLVNALWEFTSAEWLDKWDGRITAMMPHDPTEIPSLVNQESLDPQRWELVFEMLTAVHAIGGENLYGGFVSEFTREPTQRVLQLMTQAEVPIPDFSPFLQSSVLERGGWGKPRPVSFFRNRERT